MEGHEPLLPLYAGVGVAAVRVFGWSVGADGVPVSWDPLEWMAWLRWPREAVEAFSTLYGRVSSGCERVSLVYLDAGSRSSPEARRSVFAVKLAVVHRVSVGGVVEERVVHPLLRGEGGAGLPLLVGRGGDRARQAITYIVELGAVYSLLRGGCVLVLKHGPLAQQLQQYLRPSYDLDADVLHSALVYSGVERDEADAIVDAARVEGGMVNAGVAILELLSRIARLAASDGSVAVAGVTEDVTGSRVLASRLLAEAARAALDAYEGGVLKIDGLRSTIAPRIASLVRLGRAALDRLCGDGGAYPGAWA